MATVHPHEIPTVPSENAFSFGQGRSATRIRHSQPDPSPGDPDAAVIRMAQPAGLPGQEQSLKPHKKASLLRRPTMKPCDIDADSDEEPTLVAVDIVLQDHDQPWDFLEGATLEDVQSTAKYDNTKQRVVRASKTVEIDDLRLPLNATRSWIKYQVWSPHTLQWRIVFA